MCCLCHTYLFCSGVHIKHPCFVAIWGQIEVDVVTQRSFSAVYKHSLTCIYTSAFFLPVNFLSTACWLRERLLLALRRNHMVVPLNMICRQILFSHSSVNTWILHSYSTMWWKKLFPGHQKRTSAFFPPLTYLFPFLL